jgi:hypothetical protein
MDAEMRSRGFRCLAARCRPLQHTSRIDGAVSCFLLSALFLAYPISSASAQAVVSFPDPGLEAAIRDAIGMPTGPIHDYDLIGLADLDADHADISDLRGLEYCVGLTKLNLGYNQITDISPLAGLSSLTFLGLGGNQITDVSPLAVSGA